MITRSVNAIMQSESKIITCGVAPKVEVEIMSHIFNYNFPDVARKYDTMRIPQGVNIISGLLQVHCCKPLQVRVCFIGNITC